MKVKFILSIIALVLMSGAIGQTSSVIDSLEYVLKTAKEDTVKVKNLVALSKQYRNISDLDQALQYADSALVLADKLNYKKGEAEAYDMLGEIYQKQDNYPEALKSYSACLKIKEELGDKIGIAYSYNDMGIINRNLGNYTEALKNYFSTLKICEEIGCSKKNIALSYNNIGVVYYRQGNYPEALKNYFACLKIIEELGDKIGMAASYNNIGMIYNDQGNYPEALENYFSSLRICEELGIKIGIAGCYHNIGIIYDKQGNHPKALESYFASLKIREEIGDKSGIAGSYNNIGVTYYVQGNYSKALENYFSSLKISKEIGDMEAIADNYNGLGSVYIHLGNFQEARKYLDDGLALSKKMGNRPDIQSGYGSLSRLDSAEGNFAQALEHYKMYTLYKDSLFNEESNNQVSRMRIQYETEKKDREIELLNKDNEIKSLQLEQQQVSLLAARLKDEKNQGEILLMNNAIEIQELKMAEAQKEMEHLEAEAEMKATALELLNKDNELQKQQLEKQLLIRNGMVAGTVLLIIVGLLVFLSIQLRRKLEKQKTIAQERNRISADLHDDFGSSLSEIFLLSDIVIQEAKATPAKNAATKIADNSKRLLESLGEIIWALNSNNDNLESLVAYIRRYAAEYFENSTVMLKITTPVELLRTQISAEHRRNIFYAVKEALHNIIKHAQATEAEMKIKLDNEVLSIIIADNGRGMPGGELNRFGNGMINMQNRMTSIKGEFSVQNHKGTKVTLKLPVG